MDRKMSKWECTVDDDMLKSGESILGDGRLEVSILHKRKRKGWQCRSVHLSKDDALELAHSIIRTLTAEETNAK